jgi:pyruvate,water dikinase
LENPSHRVVTASRNRFVRFLPKISKGDIELVGGKGANLGEMCRADLPVPDAFVVTTGAYKAFLKANKNQEKIERLLDVIDVDDARVLEDKAALVRKLIESSPIPPEVVAEVSESYAHLQRDMKEEIASVAVRSSATTEDLKEASFAGQQSSFLNIRTERELLTAIRKCWASAFTPRAIFYRAKKGYTLSMPLTAVVVQKQIASEKSGVGFCLHPVSGDRGVVVIESSWGQGEEIVSGRVTPDTFVLDKESGRSLERKVANKKRMKIPRLASGGLEEINVPRAMRGKPSLEHAELKQLWSLARRLEDHYSYPQDFEWAIENGRVFLVQTRAVTVLRVSHAQSNGTRKPELRGLPASPGMATGPVKLVLTVAGLDSVEKGDVLVTRMTTPDFVPAMMKTAAIVTDEGGMTSHAAIVSRELGVPCVVGTADSTKILKEGATVTVDGSNGLVFAGSLPRAPPSTKQDGLEDVARLATRTKVYMNLGVPEKISDYGGLPFDGIGLMRLEFVIASYIREHPLHMLNTGREVEFVKKLAEAIGTVAKPISPRPVVVRFSDFKSNEYRELKGGEKYEEVEPNPIIGWRGVSRYISPQYEKAFRMELRAMKMARDDMKLKNVWAMLPFVRTTWEVKKCLNIIEEEGLVRDDTFKLWFMAEVPSVFFLAREFAEFCDGFSIGSNDLTQLILGIDRDSSRLGNLGYFDERNGAVKQAIRMLVEAGHEKGKTVSICGQAPSVYPDFAEYLIGLGIDSVSVNPDVVSKTKKLVHELETKLTTSPRAPRIVPSPQRP